MVEFHQNADDGVLDVEAALGRMLQRLRPVDSTRIVLDEAVGRIAAIEHVARLDAPPFAIAAMDGYALRWTDIADPLTCSGVTKAGDVIGTPLLPGTCRRIFTGAPVPPGADTVVIQELADNRDGRIFFDPRAEPYRHIRLQGSNFTAGQTLLRTGRQLTARDIGLLASAGHLQVKVYKRPRVAILSTGDELSESFAPGTKNQIIDANRPALKALIRSWGGIPIDLGIIPDTHEVLAQLVNTVSADLLVISGGASVGDFDFVGSTLSRLNCDFAFKKIRMRPGKSTFFANSQSLGILCLPGNSCASLTSALLFLKPALAQLSGLSRQPVELERACLSTALPATGPRITFLRGLIDCGTQSVTNFSVAPTQDNAMLTALAAAQAFAIRPPEAPPAKVGDMVEIIRFDHVPGF